MLGSPRSALLALFPLVVACGSDSAGSGHADAAASSDAASQIDAAPEDTSVRFIVMGDTGEGNEDQRLVALAIKDKCAAEGCDFVILLGDNIYDDGVTTVDDPQWQTKFEQPYIDVDLPFYVVLGNHDYGGQLVIDTPGIGNEWEKGPIEVQYSDVSTKWHMPDTHYTLMFGDVGFIMLDTNSLMWNNTDYGDQRDWYPSALANVQDADWVFLAGHHPYRSNGSHGNAGSYESIEVGGVDIDIPVAELNGANLKAFYDEVVCGTVDVSFSGHDHNLQWLDEPDALCGAELIVSGAGAKTTPFKDRGNASHFQDDSTEGFMYVVVDGDTFHGQFIDKNGALLYERTITR